MNSSRSTLTTSSGLKSQISSLSSAFSSALRFWLVALVGFIAVAQTGWGQGFTEGLNESVTNVTVSGGAYFTGNSASGDRPASSPFASEGTHARGVSNSTATITSNAINTTGGTGISFSFRLASFSIASTGNGADAADIVVVAISPDGGITYYDTLTVSGNSNAYWTYSATGVASAAYDGNASSVSFAPASGGSRTTDGYSTVTVTNLPAVASMRFRITMLNNSGNERWVADDIVFSGTFAPPSTITGAATASAFTTPYGTPSTAQTFGVSGSNLTANLVATAPAGFQVSSDGTTFGNTATFTQSSGSASGTLSARLSATAAVSASYNSQNIVLSSTGATSVNIVTAASGNAVTPKALTITAGNQTKTYGSTLVFGTSLFTSTELANSETIDSVTLSGSGTAATDPVNTYTITPSAATGGNFTPGNYAITYNTGTLTVDPKALTITANAVTKPFGDTLAGPVTGSTAFSSDGLVGSETIDSVTITYGAGADSGAVAGTYVDQVTPSSAVGGSFDIANYTPAYVSAPLTVTADPTITVNGTLSAVDTTYGTASTSPASFSLAGIFLTGDLTITPPAGFEAGIGGDYSNPLTVPASGTLGSTTVFVRLAATTAFGDYSGNITVSGGGATSKTVATASSSVAKKVLTISGLAGGNNPYDRTVAATTTGTAVYVGLENGESFSVIGTPTASFANATVGIGKNITVTGYTAPSANYSVTQPSGLTGDITQLALTVTGATVTSRPFDGGAVATITESTLVGVISPDVVTIATSTGIFADVNAGTGIAVTAALTLGGADAGNYSLIQPIDLSGDITKVNQFITFAALPDKLTTDAPFTLSATGGLSGQPVTFASPSSGVVTISGNTVTIVGAGTATIIASQAGDINYNAATDFARTLTVIVPPLANWTGPWSSIAASPLAATTKDANLTSASLARFGLTGASSSTRYSSSGWNTTTNYMTVTLSAATGYLINLNGTVLTGSWNSSSTGPGSFDIRSSVDNYASSVGTFASTTSSTPVSTSITLPSVGYNGLPSVTFRFIGSTTTSAGGTTASTGTGGAASIVFNGTVLTVYNNWISGFSGFTDTATTSNPDNDELTNLLEFAFGTNPTVSNSGPITYANGVITANGQPTTSITNIENGVDYRAVFGRRKDYVNAGLTYTVQFSAGLDIWVDSTDPPTVVASDATMDAVTVPYPFFIPTSRGVEKPTFFRVAVTSN